jgi:hypothetical protein
MSGKATPEDQYTHRAATLDEQQRMGHGLRWGYDRGVELAFWRRSNVTTLIPEFPVPTEIDILTKAKEPKNEPTISQYP